MSTETSFKEITDFNAVAVVERARHAYGVTDGYVLRETAASVERDDLLSAQTRIHEKRAPVTAILVPYAHRYKLGAAMAEWYDPISRHATARTGFLGRLLGALVISDTPDAPWIEQPTIMGGMGATHIDRLLYPAEPQNVPPHAQRVLIEFSELSTKLNALHEFITANPYYTTLSERQQQLLRTQFAQMDAYAVTLAQRIALF